MKKTAILCLILALTLVFTGCACNGGSNNNEPQLSTTGTDVPASTEPTTPPANTTAVPGSSIDLTSNAGTGYEWTCSIDNEAVATSTIESAGDTSVEGGNVNTKITFNGVAEGTTYAMVKLERSFEENSAVELHIYTIAVDASLKVTISEVEIPYAEITVIGDGERSVAVSDPAILVYGGEYDDTVGGAVYKVTSVTPITGEVTITTNSVSNVYTVTMNADNTITAAPKA